MLSSDDPPLIKPVSTPVSMPSRPRATRDLGRTTGRGVSPRRCLTHFRFTSKRLSRSSPTGVEDVDLAGRSMGRRSGVPGGESGPKRPLSCDCAESQGLMDTLRGSPRWRAAVEGFKYWKGRLLGPETTSGIVCTTRMCADSMS